MAVQKVDISLAARSAGHLYLTTAAMIALIFGMVSYLFVGALGFLLFSTNPEDAALSAGIVGFPVVAWTALYYARRELNSLAYAICTLLMIVLIVLLAETYPPAGEFDVGFLVYLSGIVIYLIVVVIVFGRFALSRYETLNMPQLKLANEVSKRLYDHRSSVPWVHTPTHPIRTCIYAALFGMVVLAEGIGYFSDRKVILGGLTLPIGMFGLAMLALTRRHYAMRADRLLELDNRDPILFLRSFPDDKVRLWGKGIFGKFRRKTIDEAIKRLAERLGPFVAIANPNTKLPHLGAAQTFFSNDTWQDAIARWLQMAQIVVMVAGRTEGIRWEVDHIISSKGKAKLVIFLPPGFRKDPIGGARWFSEHFSHTRYWQDLSSIDPKSVIGIAFLQDDLFVVETRRIHRREVDYLVAFQAIIFATTETA